MANSILEVACRRLPDGVEPERSKSNDRAIFAHAEPPPVNAPLLPPSFGGSLKRLAPVVGVFDSGVGGLSVLPALQHALPGAELLYVADSGHAPYGERDDAWLRERCAKVAEFLRSQGADLMVMACNTATAAAADELRALHPQWPIVGIEPGVKPAAAASTAKRVGVLATESTLRSRRYQRLLAEHGQEVEVVARACTGLAMAIERGDEHLIRQLVEAHTLPLREAQVDVVVLGCTHYPFAATQIRAAMGAEVRLIDTAEAVARRAASLVVRLYPSGDFAQPAGHPPSPPLNTAVGGGARFWTSGDPRWLESFAARWLGWAISAQRLS